MAQRHKTGSRPDVDSVRLRMQSLGAPRDVIAAEISRRYGHRPRQAYRLAHGWHQTEAAERYNQLVQARGPDHAGRDTMSPSRVSEYERWPESTRKPSIYALAAFAELYGTRIGCLIDAADLEQMSPTERAAVLGPATGLATAQPPTVVVMDG
ncbi:MAG: helix-turn-helix domain-containing protein, partial [Pseudonocardiaceae bacterium]